MSEDRLTVTSAQPETQPDATTTSGASPAALDDAGTTTDEASHQAASPSDGTLADDRSAFVARLAGAMQSIVSLERARITNYADERRRSRLQELRERDAVGAEHLRTLAADETKSIALWIEAETRRIHEEGERRKNGVQDALNATLATHRSTFDGAVESLEKTVAAYRTEVEAFFARLDGIDDPVTIAQHAIKRPVFPTLPEVPEPATSLRAVAVESDEADGRNDPGSTSGTSAGASQPDVSGDAPDAAQPQAIVLEAQATDAPAAGISTPPADRSEPATPAHDVTEPEPVQASAAGGGASALLLRTVAALRPIKGGHDDDARIDRATGSVDAGDGSCADCPSSRSRGAVYCLGCGRALRSRPAAAGN